MKKIFTFILLNTYIDFLLGATLVFAFAPFSFSFLTLIIPGLFAVRLSQQKTFGKSFLTGFLFGVGEFSLSISWIYISIHRFGGIPLVPALFITLIFIFYLALFSALQASTFYLFSSSKNNLIKKGATIKLSAIFSCSWIVTEFIRSHLFTGFPWLLLSHAHADKILGQFAPLIGELGLSGLIVFLSCLIFFSINKYLNSINSPQLKKLVYIFIFCSLFFLPFPMSFTHIDPNQPLSIKIVQGNIPEEIKMNPKYIQESVQTYHRLSEHNKKNTQLIIWPESSIPLPLRADNPYLHRLQKWITEQHRYLLFGAIFGEGNPAKFYNSAILLGNPILKNGSYFQHYAKRHLVPFGEYLPFSSVFQNIYQCFAPDMMNLSEGKSQQHLLHLDNPQLNVAVFICYEIAFSNLVQEAIPNAQLLVTLSNDAWFGHSFAQAQHEQIAQFRARQVGRFHLTVTNTGTTSVINPEGKIIEELPAFTESALEFTVFPVSGVTPWSMMGDWPIIFFAIIILASAGASLMRRRLSLQKNENYSGSISASE